MDYSPHLRSLGLDSKESTIYTHALMLGIFSASEIAAKTGLKRPTCYVILESLAEKGLVSVVHQSKKLMYKAESPNLLLKQAEQNVVVAKNIIPSLLGLHRPGEGAPIIRFYSGKKGVQSIFEDSLTGGIQEYYCIGSARHLVETAGKEFMENYVKRRVKLGIKVIGVRLEDKEVEDKMYDPTDKKALRETRFAPEGTVIPNTMFIYKNKVAVISTRDNFGFLVESTDFAESMLTLFKALWKVSRKA